VDRDAVGVGDAGEFGDGLDGAGLVVGQHEGDQDGVRGDRRGQIVRVGQARAIDG
jgi:hypothetical protein